jgi:chaperonin cofactor prefoldin
MNDKTSQKNVINESNWEPSQITANEELQKDKEFYGIRSELMWKKQKKDSTQIDDVNCQIKPSS